MDKEKTSEVIHIKDNFTIIFSYHKIDPAFVDFTVYEIGAYDELTEKIPYYQKENSNVSPDLTDKIEEAEVYIIGHIDWNGCSTIDFASSYHFCGKNNAIKMGKAIEYLYDKCAKILKVKEKGNEELYY